MHLRAPRRALERAAHGFAVKCDHLSVQRCGQALDPRPNRVGEHRWAQRTDDASQRVRTRNPVGQVKERSKPRFAVARDLFDLIPPIGTANHANQGDHEDRQERVIDTTGDARVLEVSEMRSNAQGGWRRGGVLHRLAAPNPPCKCLLRKAF